MRLKLSGTIEIGEYRARFTQDGEWAISRNGIFVGNSPTLGEIQATIDTNLEAVRARLRLAMDRASQKEISCES